MSLMGDYSTTGASSNFFVRGFGSNNHVNLNFISMNFHFTQNHHHHHHPSTSSPRHSILTFAAAILVNCLELQYQGKKDSPFETHTKTMFLAVASLLLYCFAYDLRSRLPPRVGACFVSISGGLMAIFGPLSLASLFSVLLPQFLCPPLFSLSILFSLFELPLSNVVNLWKWMRDAICGCVEILPTQQQQQQGWPRGVMTRFPLGLLQNVPLEGDDDVYNLPV